MRSRRTRARLGTLRPTVLFYVSSGVRNARSSTLHIPRGPFGISNRPNRPPHDDMRNRGYGLVHDIQHQFVRRIALSIYTFNPTQLISWLPQASRLQLHALCARHTHTVLKNIDSHVAHLGKLYITSLLSSLNSRSELQQNLSISQPSSGSHMGRGNSYRWTQHDGEEVCGNPILSIGH
jgi:hypothetical protein